MPSQYNENDGLHLLSLLEDAIDFVIYSVAVDSSLPYGGRVVMVSPSIKDIVGIDEPWQFENWFENVHPDDLERVLEANRRSWTEIVRYDETARFFNKVKGQWVWLRTISAPVVDKQGQLSHFTGIILDITQQKQAQAGLEQRVIERTQELERANATLQVEIEQRKRAEESLQLSQAHYLEVFDNSPLQMFVIEVLPDAHFRVLRTNPAHQRGSGLPPEKIWGKTIDELVIPEVAEAINRHYQTCVQARQAIEYEEQGPSPYWNLERIRTFRTTIAPVIDPQGRVVRLVGSSEDITDQKQAEGIIMQRAREEAVTAERSRLARELHDAVTQTLFSTTLMAEVLPKIWARNPDEGHKKLGELRELTRGALAEMRTLLMELRPDALADAELKDLLGHLSNAFIARARIPIYATIEDCCNLPVEVKIAFYRVAQEALNNIAKHSEAKQVTLSLTCRPEATELIVQDNGQGFDTDQVCGADHYGLRIIRERAEQIGAGVDILSQLGQGTSVKMVWAARLPGPAGK